MIDIHCHILAALDDGAGCMDDSLEMAKQAVSQGIDTVIATPHHRIGICENPKEAIFARMTALKTRLRQENIPLTILPGQEIRLYGEIKDDLERGRLLSLSETKYVLIELPYHHVPRYAEKLMFDLQVNGFIPVIAHPERNMEIMENPDRLYRLVKTGACVQITCSSLTGHFGRNVKKLARRFIEANLVHFIASDAHNVKVRSFFFDVLENEYGSDFLSMFIENAGLLIKNRDIHKVTPLPVKKKKLLGLL
ncbi:tyrosine protein phosphatase [Bacillus glycinifermentans]|uniref:Tyrosine-protein phosphatase n=1 Tax=Bacillus glycinifermentans TaxID=1664069 RepID=A0A0J6EJN1_9BACI|nr:CpsB/CapC family capsule biosynthesis tyrosine phosphatase [Bacillus glycinifermentans]KMM56864.1 tyrosine protein phosphatase [Bacillus glycinifermentans]KRT90328.1 tyrosine protein phosphatase [Bacillus glycinifermentans]MEC0484024.1 tyrosine protein phosphatase [Bacillus glycinifermentans]MEC0492857.1 tyrosine protein phosphatase [Bacillus glycinifermentans]MEC0539939.1 tyrosine protein phosphatase [Bacillus glycinifermentans]